MKTPPKFISTWGIEILLCTESSAKWRAGLLGRAGTWSRGPVFGDATVEPAVMARDDRPHTRLRGQIPSKLGPLFRAPTRHPSAKADGTCSALRGTWRPISGHLRHARLAHSHGYWQRRLEPQLARNSTRHHPESLMKYPS